MFNKIKNLVGNKKNSLDNTSNQLTTLNLDIEGMSCGHCSGAVTKLVENLPGVSNVSISHENNNGQLDVDDNIISKEAILEIINEGGKYIAKLS